MSEVYTNFAKCPYCHKIQKDLWEINLEDDESTQIDCSSCEKEFRIHLTILYEYTVSTMEEI